ncbi:MAG: hypothetical protein HC850_05395 [Rhodomicrobium sp.]|nr:hypothetical protein [Rhodomicrobium sp.]
MNETEAIDFLTATRRMLASQQDLSPNNPEVNRCLGRFVATLRACQTAGFGQYLPDRPELAGLAGDLARLCGKAECAMEKWWCRRILASDCPAAQALAAFWYLDEYKALHSSELALIDRKPASRFAFLGSGALPVTAILMAQSQPEVSINCVDCDAEACELAERLIKLIGLKDRITIIMDDAMHYGAAPDELVLCASLLDAPYLFPALLKRGAQHLIVRDAEGVYRFCYRPSALPETGFIERAKSAPSTARINTSRYFEAAPPPLDASHASHQMIS